MCEKPCDGWTQLQLGKIATLQRGLDLPVQDRHAGKIPVYGSNGIDGFHDKAAVKGPGVITGRSGSIGSVFYEDDNFWPLNTSLYVKDFHGNDQKYVARLLESLNLKNFSASTGVPSLNRNFIHPLIVRRPPVVEQQTIATILDTMDEAIRRTEAVIAKLRQVKAGMLHDLLTRGLDENGELRDPIRHPEQFKDSPMGRIPKAWEVQTLVEICEKILDGTHFSPRSTSGPRMYITSKNIRFGYLDLNKVGWISEKEHESIYRRCDVMPGDILLTKDGAGTGNAAVNTIAESFSLLSSVALLRCDERKLHNMFLLQTLLSPMFQKNIQEAMSGNAITRLTLAKINNFPLALPFVEEQLLISKILNGIQQRSSTEECLYKKLKTQKQGLMHDLLNGTVRVPPQLLEAAP